MILFIFRHADAARSAGFHNGRHSADPELLCCWNGGDIEHLRGVQLSRVFTINSPMMNRREAEFIRAQLRIAPMTWINL